jgi:predicted nucleic acid-binding protein
VALSASRPRAARESETWLADTSAIVRFAETPDRELWAGRVQRGLVRVATVTLLELGYSARSERERAREFSHGPLAAMPTEYLTPRAEDRALEVQAMLTARGQHRSAAIPDLLIAAVAELTGLIVIHLDRHFELIAELTGQPVQSLRMD